MKNKNTNKKLHVSSDKPKECTICSNKDQNKITNIIKEQETDAWFCLKCGGLIGWTK